MPPSITPILDRIVEKLKDEYCPERIILFGSYAYGTPNEDSDIDLFIVKESDEPPWKRGAEVKRIISDPLRRIPVSPKVRTPVELDERLALGDQFIEEIIQLGIELYPAFNYTGFPLASLSENGTGSRLDSDDL